ncbi:MAG TPA: hypothetical protein VEL69_05480 [Ktedonobacteraceae bacterium]|nr:hypothetical protein [Ktedonobacteraceae bacterium]
MVMPPIPIQRYLVPDTKPTLPEGFTQVDEPMLNGLPHRIQLTQSTTLIVVMPTGLATTWRDVDPTTVVSQSDDEVSPAGLQAEASARPPVRIIVQRAGAPLVSIPLAAGALRAVWDSGRSDLGAQFELMLLSWDIRAGSLRGAGDFGSRISLAWRRADQAVMQYSTPPINPVLLPRLPKTLRLESVVGLRFYEKLQRFQIKKVVDHELAFHIIN